MRPTLTYSLEPSGMKMTTLCSAVAENSSDEIQSNLGVGTRRLREKRVREVNWCVMMIVIVIVIVVAVLSSRVERRKHDGQQGA